MADTTTAPDATLRAENITLTYQDGRNVVYAVKHVDLNINAGEFVGILGPSGSGKTSLLYALSGIRPPVEGRVYLDGRPIDSSGVSREELRRRHFGFVFQQYFLINYLSVLQNIIVGASRVNRESRERGRSLAARLGLDDLEHRKPYELSAGTLPFSL